MKLEVKFDMFCSVQCICTMRVHCCIGQHGLPCYGYLRLSRRTPGGRQRSQKSSSMRGKGGLTQFFPINTSQFNTKGSTCFLLDHK